MLYIISFISMIAYSGAAFCELVWQKDDDTAKFSWGDAEVIKTAQFYCNYLKEDDKKWRIPSAEELIKTRKTDFNGIYWSSTPIKNHPKKAIAIVSLRDQRIPKESHTDVKLKVRCVREI